MLNALYILERIIFRNATAILAIVEMNILT